MEHLLSLVICTLLLVKSVEGVVVPITYVQSAVPKGAVWLDGSPPTYHFDKGFDAGIDNWIVRFMGGGWCNNASPCLDRRDTPLGSSKKMDTTLSFSVSFSNEKSLTQISTIGTESWLGIVTVHHLPVMLKLLIQQPICTTEEEEYLLLSLRIY